MTIRVFSAGLLLVIVPMPAPAVSFENDVLAEINDARTHPSDYAERLRAYRDSFAGTVAHPDGDPMGFYTREGPGAVEEAIAFLDAQRPLPPLDASDLLASAASDLVADQGPRGALGHISSTGLDPGQRVRRRGGDVYVSEAIAYGAHDPAAVARNLIIDDGVARRGHRALLFSAMFGFAGIACGPHAAQGSMCVVDLSASPDGKPQVPPEGGARTP